jgi:hypothetical protein
MYWFHIAFVYDRMYLLFAPKLPFLGLIITAGTFQYRVWSDLADRGKRRITDPQWLELGRRVQERRRRLDANPISRQRGGESLRRLYRQLSCSKSRSWRGPSRRGRSNAQVADFVLRGVNTRYRRGVACSLREAIDGGRSPQRVVGLDQLCKLIRFPQNNRASTDHALGPSRIRLMPLSQRFQIFDQCALVRFR